MTTVGLRGQDLLFKVKDQYFSASRKYAILMALSLPTFLLSLDTSVLYLAMPHIDKDLKAESAQQLWIMDSYGFMMAGFLVVMGNLGDRIGYRKLLLIGAGIFGLASLLAAFSPNVMVLIFARALMGMAGAMMMPSTLALISATFNGTKERTAAMSVWLSCLMAGMIIGPLAGGLMLEYFWWGSVFLLSVPLMAAIVIAGSAILPEYKHQNTRPLNIRSALLLLSAILPFIYGLTELSRNNRHALPIAAILTGLVAGLLFIKNERSANSPLADPVFFRNRVFSITLTAMFLVAVIMGGMAVLIAEYLQMVLDLPPLEAGLWMIPQAAGMIICFIAIPLIAARVHQCLIISTGLYLSAAGMLLITLVPAVNGLMLLETGFVLAIIGVAPTLLLGTRIIISAAPAEKAGAAASLSETANQLGIALGIALLGSMGTWVYRTTLIRQHPAAFPTRMLTKASESLIQASSLASGLHVPAKTVLLTLAKSAFVNGLTHVAALSAAVFILLAKLTGAGLRISKQLS